MGAQPQRSGPVPAGVSIYHPKIWDGRRFEEPNPEEEFLSIVTVNITYLSQKGRKGLGELPYNIIMIQEHHRHGKQGMGKIPGFSIVFFPAHITQVRKRKKGRGKVYHTKGGVAVLYRPRLTRFLQPGVDMVGHNWCALMIKLAKNRVLIWSPPTSHMGPHRTAHAP